MVTLLLSSEHFLELNPLLTDSAHGSNLQDQRERTQSFHIVAPAIVAAPLINMEATQILQFQNNKIPSNAIHPSPLHPL